MSGQQVGYIRVSSHSQNHDRQLDLSFVEHLAHGHDSGLRIQRVEDGLDQQQVDAAVDECPGLLLVRRAQLIESDAAQGRVVHVG